MPSNRDGQINAEKVLAPYYQPKFIEDVTMVLGSVLKLRQGIPNSFPLKGLLLHFLFRITVADPGGGVAGTVLPEAPFSLITRVLVSGNHRVRGNETLIDVDGATLRRYNQFYEGVLTPFYNPDTLAGAAASYDISCDLYVPFALQRVRPHNELATLLDAQGYSDYLNLEVTLGTGAALFSATHTMTDTIAAFEGAVGPVMKVNAIQANLGADVKFNPMCIKRWMKWVDGNIALTDAKLTDLPVGNQVRSYMIKYFTGRAGDTHVVTFPTESATFITSIKAKLNNVAIRDLDARTMNRWDCYRSKLTEGQNQMGYVLLEFVENGDLNQALKTFDFAARAKAFELHTTQTAAASQRVGIFTTEILPARG